MKKFTIGLMIGTITVLILAVVNPDSLVNVYIAFGVSVISWILYDLLVN